MTTKFSSKTNLQNMIYMIINANFIPDNILLRNILDIAQ